ncbi:oleate hydratase [Streptomyces sp. NPDC056653]|uniref:oleate hydratase n=1 Tax=Streptomyces sp. NPDC056653 TaxID=3345894 RepID=UPI00368BCACE
MVRNYDRINAQPPEGINEKRAHILGGGIAGLAAAAFLVDDAHMPGTNVTVYEASGTTGGAMDAAGDAETGYKPRGHRELHASHECLWYLCGKVPSIHTPGATVLEETYDVNVREPIRSNFRLMARQGERHEVSGPLMSAEDGRKMLDLWLTPEEDLDGITLGDWFSPEFFNSVYWLCWSTMFAFWPYHSVMEARRYMLRYADLTGSNVGALEGILHPKYNEYHSFTLPLHKWLERQGVKFRTSTSVTDIAVSEQGGETVATGVTLRDADGEHRLQLTRDDLVFFTNGSIVQNATQADTTTVATLNRDTADRGVFTVWEKLAARDPRFGNPAAFLSDVDKTNFYTFMATITGDRTFHDHMEAKTGSKGSTGGMLSVVDSNWKLNLLPLGTYHPDQPADVHVLHGYGQLSNVPGNHVEKPMRECTGAEVLAEVLYHCGLKGKIAAILEHSKVHTAALPYITSQFMPRKISDRPKVIPDGCVNLAFLGQYVELPEDVVFTVETSVRTAMMAVWGLTGLEKPMVPMPQPYYDVRVLADNVKMMTGIDITADTLHTLVEGGSGREATASEAPAPAPTS